MLPIQPPLSFWHGSHLVFPIPEVPLLLLRPASARYPLYFRRPAFVLCCVVLCKLRYVAWLLVVEEASSRPNYEGAF